MSTSLRALLKGGLYLAAIVLLPGALIGAPLLWFIGQRRKTHPQPTWKSMLLTQRCQQYQRKLGGNSSPPPPRQFIFDTLSNSSGPERHCSNARMIERA